MIIAFFAPVHKLLGLTVALVAIDTFTGVVAAIKRKRKLTSKRLSAAIIKSAVYLIAICAAYLVENHFLPELPVVRMLTAAIGLRELLSVFENLNIISDGNLFDEILKKIKESPPKD